MIIDTQTMEDVFQEVHASIRRTRPDITEAINHLRPSDPSLMDWRYELRGLVRGLTATDAVGVSTLIEVEKALFGRSDFDTHRPGRDFTFSVDVYGTSADGSARLLQFDVAAMNPMDAYVQLTKRLVYRTIPDIQRVEVFHQKTIDRTDQQVAAKRFNKEDLVFVPS